MAYGSAEGVSVYAKAFTRGGSFFDASVSPLVSPTNPTLTEVNDWLDQVSAMFDVALMNEGFLTPVTATNSLMSITLKVETLVSDLCAYANSTGRLYNERTLERGGLSIVNKEVNDWVKANTTGLVNDGVPRTLPDSKKSGGFSTAQQRKL